MITFLAIYIVLRLIGEACKRSRIKASIKERLVEMESNYQAKFDAMQEFTQNPPVVTSHNNN